MGVVAAVWNFYAGKALQLGGQEGDLRTWVARKSESALREIVLTDDRGCGYCHYGTRSDDGFDIENIIGGARGLTQTVPRFIAPVWLRTPAFCRTPVLITASIRQSNAKNVIKVFMTHQIRVHKIRRLGVRQRIFLG